MGLKDAVKQTVPERFYRGIVSRWRYVKRTRVKGDVLELDSPVSEIWGLDRGTPIDRWYTEDFLSRHALDIHGRVLEMADPRYTRRFGTDVSQSDVLHLVEGNPDATMIGDLVEAGTLPNDAFDCLVVINTFPIIFEARTALRNCYLSLTTGGVLLANFHGIYPRVPEDPAWEGDYWRFTSHAVQRMCEEAGFIASDISVEAAGNVRSAAAYLYGMAAEELGEEAMRKRDERYEVVINVRAVRR